ncbi:clasp N terminal-domain-containing protein [Phascolomyces articulosus]|uniref:Clasp N terminal-domain-containing protein n=1 Tax=Phascolomyces articulosus TaxID=60185 RepID=A0AAD5JVV3_9FUNG|nr:clasp N terminal-domain-containing protein [Phascolomyces articulosus]
MKETERYLTSMLKHFDGKESDTNWEVREQTINRLREIVQSTIIPEEKVNLARYIRSYGEAIGHSVQSLRTTLALSALGLVEDIGVQLGYDLDPFTTDLLFLRLFRCASTTKKIIAIHAKDACNSYLSNIPYRFRIVQHITEVMGEKNIQLRHYATLYLKTILETHTREGNSGNMIEKSGGLDLVEKAMKKGLSDASPMVREAWRQVFSILQIHWPERTSRLMQSLDTNVQKSLDKISVTKTTTSTKPIMKRPSSYRSSLSSVSSFSTVSTVSTCSSWSSASSSLSARSTGSSTSRPSSRSRLYSQPTLRTNSPLASSQKSFNVPSPSKSSSSLRTTTREKYTQLASLPPPIRVPRKRVLEEEEGKEDKDIVKMKTQRYNIEEEEEDKSIPSDHSMNNNTHHINQYHYEQQQQQQQTRPFNSQLAMATLLQMLKSDDINSNCRAIRRLSEKLKGFSNVYGCGSFVLPNDVPSTTDLQPILINYISREKTKDHKFWKTLMSWDCVVGIYTRVLSLQHYIPALILASQDISFSLNHHTDNNNNNRHGTFQSHSSSSTQIKDTCRIGIGRLRMYLGAYDTQLPKHLLETLDQTRFHFQDQKQQQQAIVLYLVEWMDELVCEYVGLGKDKEDDQDKEETFLLQVKEGSDVYFEEEGHPAYPWFDDETNIQEAMSQCLSLLEVTRQQEQEGKDGSGLVAKTLTTLVGRLRLSNERVFDPFSERFELAMQPSTCGSPQKDPAINIESPLLMCQDWKFDDTIVDTIPDEEESSGATQEFSKMDLQTNKNFTTGYSGGQQQQQQHTTVADLELQQEPQEKLDQNNHQKLKDVLIRSLEEPTLTLEKWTLWQNISSRSPVIHMETSDYFTLWTSHDTSSGPFIMLLEKVMASVVSSERDETMAIEALRLVKSLLRHQPAVLKYYQQMTTNKEEENCTLSIAYLLAEVLQRATTSPLIKLSSLAETTFVELLSVLSDKQKLQIIWSLLREWLENNEQKSAVRALFVYLSKTVSKVERISLESSLDPSILIKGYNHAELIVRRACVQSIVEIYKILGEGFLKTYLSPSLRIDQIDLLRHYINMTMKDGLL